MLLGILYLPATAKEIPEIQDYVSASSNKKAEDHSYLPMLEVGKKWIYTVHDQYDPIIDGKDIEILAEQKSKLDERYVFNLRVMQPGLDAPYYLNAYEENGIGYFFYEEYMEYVPMIDLDLELGKNINGYELIEKGYDEIEGISRYVLTFHDKYSDSRFYWIEGIGSTRSSFLTPLVTSTNGGHLELKECYQNDLCIYRNETTGESPKTEYKPIIRDDRVWECITGTWGPFTVKYMKFDGIEELLGKTYHRIVTFKKSVVDINSPIEDCKYEFFDDVYEHEGYMREEDGKVYTLVIEGETEPYYEGAIYIPSWSYQEDLTLNERLIYDLTSEVGNCYDAFSSVTLGGEFMNFKTVARTAVNVEDEECVMIGMCPTVFSDNHNISYCVVEGVGPIGNGCLNYTEFIDSPTRPWTYNFFNRLFDLNGNVIFRNQEDCLDFRLPENLFSSVETLGETNTLMINANVISYDNYNCHNSVAIYDMNGRMLKTASARGKVTVSTADLHPGIYIAVPVSDGIAASPRKFSIH